MKVLALAVFATLLCGCASQTPTVSTEHETDAAQAETIELAAAQRTEVANESSRIPVAAEELSGDWTGQTVVNGLKCQHTFDTLSQPFVQDVSVKVDVSFDQSAEAAPSGKIDIDQECDAVGGTFGGLKSLSGGLSDSANGTEVEIVFYYTKTGSPKIHNRTVGKLSRADSGDLLLTLSPPASGIFDTNHVEFAPVKNLRLVKRDPAVKDREE